MITLSSMALGAPAMLAGLALISLPVLAHLLHRRARRHVLFPTTMLLVASAASQSHLFKLRRLLLLALRCLAMAMLILAFARPIWLRSQNDAAASEEGVALVILFDISASAAQDSQGVPVIYELQAAAERTIGSLLEGADAANIVYAAAQPRPAFVRMTANLAAIRQEIQSAKPTYERADLRAALGMAGKLLAERRGSRHLVILSDLQATNWVDTMARLGADKPLPDQTQITIVPLESAPSGNVALSEAALSGPMAIVARPTEATVKLTNFSARAQVVTTSLRVDGRPVGSQSVSLGPWQQRSAAFKVQFDKIGHHRLQFVIPDDSFPVDNSRDLVARAVERIPVVVLADDDPNEPGTSSYFTIRALAPFGDRRDHYEVRHRTSAGVSWKHLSGATTVFVCDVHELPTSLNAALHRFVDSGHGLVFFCGAGPVNLNLAALDRLANGALLPWEPGAFRDLAAQGDQLFLSRGNWESSLLRIFDDRSRMVLSQIRIGRVWEVASVDPEADVLLKFSDGSPALAVRSVGSGKFMLANFSADLSDSDLGKYGSFVALMQILVSDLQAPAATGRDGTVGRSLAFSSLASFDPARGGLAVHGPDGALVPDANFSLDLDNLVVHLSRTDKPGVYVASQHQQPIGMAAANVDPRESDLRRVNTEVLREQLMELGAQAVIARASADQELSLELRGRPLWGWMLVAALAALGLEMGLVGYWRR